MSEFADYPVSITEARGDRDDDCRVWQPRDALISVLRDIDSGKVKPDALVVVYRFQEEDGELAIRTARAVPDVDISLGLLARAQAAMMNDQ